jgi:hypothetical protein
MPELEERVRVLEISGATQIVEVNHLKEAIAAAAETMRQHAISDSKTHGGLRSENRRFLIGVFMLILAALVGAYFK